MCTAEETVRMWVGEAILSTTMKVEVREGEEKRNREKGEEKKGKGKREKEKVRGIRSARGSRVEKDIYIACSTLTRMDWVSVYRLCWRK